MEQGPGEREGSIMKNKMRDENMPVGKLNRIKDFLPPPSELVISEETVKVTLSLKKTSVIFFKQVARRHHTKYQRMIRELLDKYAARYPITGDSH